MIEYIKGDLAELTPAMAVIEAAGVGYALNISLNTYTAIQGKEKVKLFVHEALVTAGATIRTRFMGSPRVKSANFIACLSAFRALEPIRHA